MPRFFLQIAIPVQRGSPIVDRHTLRIQFGLGRLNALEMRIAVNAAHQHGGRFDRAYRAHMSRYEIQSQPDAAMIRGISRFTARQRIPFTPSRPYRYT